jgi:hypothetical protein
MKIARAISIALYAIAFMVIGSHIYRALFESGGGRSGGFGYGNLWIRYSVEERGVLSPKIPWLIAMPEMPTRQTYEGDKDQWTFVFANGRVFTFRPDSENLVWIDPSSGPTTVPADLTGELVQRIEQTRDRAQGTSFKNADDLLTWLDKQMQNKSDMATPNPKDSW